MDNFVEISLFTITPDDPLPFRIAVKFKGQNIIYRKPGQKLDGHIYNRFIFHRIHQVLIPKDDFGKYKEYQALKSKEKEAECDEKKVSKDQSVLNKMMQNVIDVAGQIFSSENDRQLQTNVEEAMKASKKVVETVLSRPYVRIYDSLSYKADNVIAHSTRISFLSTFLGYQLGFVNPNALEYLAGAALVHDIGKIRLEIADEYAEDGAPLEIDEEMMKQHPLVSCDILSKMSFVPEEVVRIVLEHHETRDGSGYPNGIRGPKMFGLSKVMVIANTFDELASKAKGPQKERALIAAKTMINEMREKFDPTFLPKAMNCLVGEASKK